MSALGHRTKLAAPGAATTSYPSGGEAVGVGNEPAPGAARTRLDDPPRRADGLCACGCGKPLLDSPPKTMAKHLRPEFERHLHADPFRSSACARRFHGCELPTTANRGGSAWDDEAKAAEMRAAQYDAGFRNVA